MTETQGTALRAALAVSFAPLVRILLRKGVSHRVSRDIGRADKPELEV